MNLSNFWDEAEGKELIHALRDIEKGEEITNYYGKKVLADREERRKDLKQKFEFICQCETCSLNGEELDKSNKVRKILATLVEAGPSFTHGDPSKAIHLIKLADRLMDKREL